MHSIKHSSHTSLPVSGATPVDDQNHSSLLALHSQLFTLHSSLFTLHSSLFTLHFSLLTFLLFFTACDNDGGATTETFDRKEMLKSYADFVIKPAFAGLQSKVDALQIAFNEYDNAPSPINQGNLEAAHAAAWLAFQEANAFNFGPAGESGIKKGLVEEIGTFPANALQIEAFIAAGDLSLNNFNRDTRGFPTLEYLLYVETNGSLENAARRAYFKAVLNHLKAQVDNVVTAWDTYAAVFADNNGTDAGSSTSMLYNEFVRSFEAIKNFKVGLPAGKRPGQTAAAPELAEGYYSDQTLTLLKAHLKAIDVIYHGNANVNGFDAYLKTITGGETLVADTEAQWNVVMQALNAVPTDQPFSVLLQQNHPSIDTLHTELQRHTRFFKSEMSSLLGIAITFSSGDGD